MAIPKRINVGERLDGYPALTHNYLVDHAQRGDRSHLTERAPTPGQHTSSAAARIVVKNNCGQDIEANEVVQLVSSVFDVDGEAANRSGTFVAGAELPAANGPLAFAITPINDGEVGPVAVLGAVVCQVEITDSTHTHARRIDGDRTKLTSGAGGYPFLRFTGASGTGDEYCLVMLERRPTTIVVGEVKKTGGVTGSDAEFDVDNLALVTGDDPRDDPSDSTETVIFVNTFAQSYSDTELVMGFARDADGKFDTDKLSSGSGAQIAEFELTENMSYADTYKLAKPLDASHNLNTGATAVRLLDLDGKWFGLAAYNSVAGAERGYRFFARFVTSDHASSGIAGWEIIAGEGPAPLLRVKPQTYGSDQWTVVTNKAFGGGWASGRLPKEESGSFDITCTDPDDLASGSPSTAIFLAAWAPGDEAYQVVAALRKLTGALAYTYTAITAASSVSGTLTPGTGDVYLYESQGDGTWDKAGTTITAYNSVDEAVAADKVVQLKDIDGYWFVDVEPCS